MLYDNDAPPGNAFIEITSTLFSLGFGVGLLFIPVHWVAASSSAFRAVKLPVMLCIASVSTFITYSLITSGSFIEYLQSKGLFWVLLGVTITCSTVLWKYYKYRRSAIPCGGSAINDATPVRPELFSEND